jgi:hypothetical protein
VIGSILRKSDLRFLVAILSSLFFLYCKANAQIWTPVGPSDSTQFPNCGYEYRSVVVDKNGAIYVAYIAQPDYFISSELLVAKYQNGKWQQLGGTIDDLRSTEGYSLALDSNSNLYLAYCKTPFSGPQNYDSYVKKFDGENWVLMGDSIKNVLIDFHSLTISDSGNIYLAAFNQIPVVFKFNIQQDKWMKVGSLRDLGLKTETDNSDIISILTNKEDKPIIAIRNKKDNDELSVLLFDGLEWNRIGYYFTPAQIQHFSMAINSSDSIYLAFDYNGSYSSIVKYEGVNHWSSVGPVRVFNNAYCPRICFDSNNQFYFTFLHTEKIYNNYGNPALYKFANGGWELINDSIWQTAYIFDLKMDNKNNPFIFGIGYNVSSFIFRFENNMWNSISKYGISGSTAIVNNILIDKNQFPYVAIYNDSISDYEVLKFNGLAWETVGSSGLSKINSAGPIYDLKLAVDDENNLYASYFVLNDTSFDMNLYVIKFDGSKWEPLGNQIFTNDNFDGYYFQIDNSNNRPCIAYPNDLHQQFLVYEFNGINWVQFPLSKDENTNSCCSFSFAMDNKGKMYGYIDYADHILTFDGSEWVNLEPEPLSNYGIGTSLSLAVDSKDSLYAACSDPQIGTLSYNGSVKKWNGSTWRTIGQDDFLYDFFPYSPGYSNFKISGTTPYILNEDGPDGKWLFKKFDGAAWINVSDSTPTDRCSENYYLFAFDSTDYLYEVVTEQGNTFVFKLKDTTRNQSTEIISQNSPSSFIQIFPNPSDGNFTLKAQLPYPAEKSNLQMFIYNAIGKLVWHSPLFNHDNLLSTQVSLAGLPAGIYSILLESPMGRFLKEIVIQ